MPKLIKSTNLINRSSFGASKCSSQNSQGSSSSNRTLYHHSLLDEEVDLSLVGTKKNINKNIITKWGFLETPEGEVLELALPNKSYELGREAVKDTPLFVSRKHCLIRLLSENPTDESDLRVVLIDVDSINGVTINNKTVTPNRKVNLNHGDVIILASPGHCLSSSVISQMFTFLKPRLPSLHQEYKYLSQLGKGGSGRVMKAYNYRSGLYYAVKVIKITLPRDQMELKICHREINIMKLISHPFVIELCEVVLGKEEIGLVLPLAPHGSLFQIGYHLNTFEPKQRLEIMYQLLSGVRYFHKHNITHRDLKPDNILVISLSPLRIRIADLGCSKIMRQGRLSISFTGTEGFMAPEVCEERSCNGYSAKSDLWSLGVILYLNLKLSLPFVYPYHDLEECDMTSLFKGISSSIPDKELVLLKSLLTLEPIKRISADEALALPYFKDELLKVEDCIMEEYNHVSPLGTLPMTLKYSLQDLKYSKPLSQAE